MVPITLYNRRKSPMESLFLSGPHLSEPLFLLYVLRDRAPNFLIWDFSSADHRGSFVFFHTWSCFSNFRKVKIGWTQIIEHRFHIEVWDWCMLPSINKSRDESRSFGRSSLKVFTLFISFQGLEINSKCLSDALTPRSTIQGSLFPFPSLIRPKESSWGKEKHTKTGEIFLFSNFERPFFPSSFPIFRASVRDARISGGKEKSASNGKMITTPPSKIFGLPANISGYILP